MLTKTYETLTHNMIPFIFMAVYNVYMPMDLANL